MRAQPPAVAPSTHGWPAASPSHGAVGWARALSLRTPGCRLRRCHWRRHCPAAARALMRACQHAQFSTLVLMHSSITPALRASQRQPPSPAFPNVALFSQTPPLRAAGGGPAVPRHGVLCGRRPGPPAACRQAAARGGGTAPDAAAGGRPAPDVGAPPRAREKFGGLFVLHAHLCLRRHVRACPTAASSAL